MLVIYPKTTQHVFDWILKVLQQITLKILRIHGIAHLELLIILGCNWELSLHLADHVDKDNLTMCS